jgi:tyrosinase
MATAMDLAASGVVVGMKELTGDVQVRVDIDVMLTEQPDAFNLMLLALAAMQKNPDVIKKIPGLDQNDLLSYYSIAGIHGFPRAAWDGVANQFEANKMFGGYCPHGRIIFPTWHRPYLMLMEVSYHPRSFRPT